MKNRSIKLIIFGLCAGALIGTLVGNVLSFLLPDGSALPSGNKKERTFPTKVPINAPAHKPKIINFILLFFIPLLVLNLHLKDHFL